MATQVESGQQAGWGNGTMAEALRRMAESEPELAARLIVQSLPVAAAPLPADLSWRLDVDGVGAWEVTRQRQRRRRAGRAGQRRTAGRTSRSRPTPPASPGWPRARARWG